MRQAKKNKERWLSNEIRKKESRMLKAKKRKERSVWFGFGMFGLIGWSVVVPTVAGILLGMWLDKHVPINHSWTLTLMLAGLVAGCFNAWRWISKENKQIEKEQEDNDE